MPRVVVANRRCYNEGILMHRNSGFVWIATVLVLASAPCLAEQRPVVVQPNKPVLILPSAGSQKKTTDSNQKIERKNSGEIKLHNNQNDDEEHSTKESKKTDKSKKSQGKENTSKNLSTEKTKEVQEA